MSTPTSFLDPYRVGSSILHRLDARIKTPLFLGLILVTALIPFSAWPLYPILIALTFAASILAEIGVLTVQRRALLALPFVLAALPLMFTVKGVALLTLPVGPWELTLTQSGLERFIAIGLKSWISVQIAVLLAATTTMPDLLLAARTMGVPRVLAAVIGLMWRYLFLMVDETVRLMRARTARSGSSGGRKGQEGGRLTWRARVTGGMAGSLLLRSFERSERVYAAMLARGYDGEVRNLPHPALTRRDWLVLGFGVGLLFFLGLLGILLG